MTFDYRLFIIFAILNVLLASIAQIFLKKSAQISHASEVRKYINLRVIIGYLILIVCLFINTKLLKVLPLSILTLIETLSYVYAIAIGRIFFNESITKTKIYGALLITIGIVVIIIQ